MNKITVLLMVVIMALCFVLGTTMQSRAQNKGYSGIVPFVSTTDRVGFLDQNTGRIYMYDSNISQCLFVGQIQNLGDPIDVIKNKAAITNNL